MFAGGPKNYSYATGHDDEFSSIILCLPMDKMPWFSGLFVEWKFALPQWFLIWTDFKVLQRNTSSCSAQYCLLLPRWIGGNLASRFVIQWNLARWLSSASCLTAEFGIYKAVVRNAGKVWVLLIWFGWLVTIRSRVLPGQVGTSVICVMPLSLIMSANLSCRQGRAVSFQGITFPVPSR